MESFVRALKGAPVYIQAAEGSFPSGVIPVFGNVESTPPGARQMHRLPAVTVAAAGVLCEGGAVKGIHSLVFPGKVPKGFAHLAGVPRRQAVRVVLPEGLEPVPAKPVEAEMLSPLEMAMQRIAEDVYAEGGSGLDERIARRLTAYIREEQAAKRLGPRSNVPFKVVIVAPGQIEIAFQKHATLVTGFSLNTRKV